MDSSGSPLGGGVQAHTSTATAEAKAKGALLAENRHADPGRWPDGGRLLRITFVIIGGLIALSLVVSALNSPA